MSKVLTQAMLKRIAAENDGLLPRLYWIKPILTTLERYVINLARGRRDHLKYAIAMSKYLAPRS